MNPRIRCAIYTRKSTDEGLEQSFNSLEAQREAGEAYVKSQQHEGWQTIPTHYDDGGFSGGNMERPALKQIMDDIQANKINVVVVYKVDRLTRSLADFAKIIEQFDKYGVSFVSVTQQFNTTTSMGRLTLNVLLSFAQFEREVTSERIRDKIAASKKKGMWMGGSVALGYEVRDRKLVVNEPEAATVRLIFREFLRLGSVLRLEEWLRENNVRSRLGNNIMRGPLYTMLHNPHYIGLVRHKKETYPGEHAAIIDGETWDRAQALLNENLNGDRRKARSTKSSLFTGVIFDANGTRYSPSHATKYGRRYRYYTSQSVIRKNGGSNMPVRIPAPDIEKAVIESILNLLRTPKELLDLLRTNLLNADTDPTIGFYTAIMDQANKAATSWNKRSAPYREQFLKTVIDRVVIHCDHIEVLLRLSLLIQNLIGVDSTGQGLSSTDKFAAIVSITCPFRHVQHGRALRLIVGDGQLANGRSRRSILRALAQAQLWRQQIADGEVPSLYALARRDGVDASWAKKIFPLAFLSPASTESILRTNIDLTLSALLANIPMEWSRQSIR